VGVKSPPVYMTIEQATVDTTTTLKISDHIEPISVKIADLNTAARGKLTPDLDLLFSADVFVF